MKKNNKREPKLALLFKGLTAKDLRKLGKYLQNPAILAKHAKALALFQYLKGRSQEERFAFLCEKVFYKVFEENQAFELQKLREVAAALVKRIENYLIIDESIRFNSSITLIEAQKRRGMSKLHYTNLKSLASETSSSSEIGRPLPRLYEELYFHPLTSKLNGEEANNHLVQAIFDLDSAYLTSRLRLFCEQHTTMQYHDKDHNHNTQLIPYLIDYGSDVSFIQKPLLRAYWMIAKMFRNQERGQYSNYKSFISQNIKQFPHHDQGNLINLAINFVHIFIKEQRLEEFFYWYDLGFKLGAFLENGVVVKIHFNNTVHVASNLKKYHWLESFIIKYEKQISTKDAREVDNLKKLVKAYIEFGQKNWDIVAINLLQLKFDDLSFSLRWHVLNIKNIYEEQKQDGLLEIASCGKKFEKFLNRKLQQKSTTKSRHQSNLNFIKYITQIASFDPSRHSGQYFSPEVLFEEVSTCPLLVEKRWLLEKIEELGAS